MPYGYPENLELSYLATMPQTKGKASILTNYASTTKTTRMARRVKGLHMMYAHAST